MGGHSHTFAHTLNPYHLTSLSCYKYQIACNMSLSLTRTDSVGIALGGLLMERFINCDLECEFLQVQLLFCLCVWNRVLRMSGFGTRNVICTANHLCASQKRVVKHRNVLTPYLLNVTSLCPLISVSLTYINCQPMELPELPL